MNHDAKNPCRAKKNSLFGITKEGILILSAKSFANSFQWKFMEKAQ
jgi:hypothetical protein